MKLPILAYGFPILHQKCIKVSKESPKLKQLIADMWETMYAAHGAGLAAPQIGKSLRIFIVDTIQSYKTSSFSERKMFIGDNGIKEVFINPQLIELDANTWFAGEGCLSMPGIQLEVERKISVMIKYFNENFEPKEMLFSGSTARAVQHEYDHIEGILFTDYSEREIIKDKLEKISAGDVKPDYKMKFNKSKIRSTV